MISALHVYTDLKFASQNATNDRNYWLCLCCVSTAFVPVELPMLKPVWSSSYWIYRDIIEYRNNEPANNRDIFFNIDGEDFGQPITLIATNSYVPRPVRGHFWTFEVLSRCLRFCTRVKGHILMPLENKKATNAYYILERVVKVKLAGVEVHFLMRLGNKWP